MQSATVQSISGSVTIVTEGKAYLAQVGDEVALNAVVVAAENSECMLECEHGSVLIAAQQKLLIDEDVLGASVDPISEAQVSQSSFQHAVVQIALADPDHILSQLLTNLNSLLNQSMDTSPFVDSALLEDHSLFLEVEAEQMQSQDLLTEGLNAAREQVSELSLEEALTGELTASAEADVSEATFSVGNTEALVHILETSQDSMEFDGLIGQLVQVMDLSKHFSSGGENFASLSSLEIGLNLDDDDFVVSDSPYQQI
ncbi:Retention module-containing protein [uncultured Thiomicrorhabdus sp.]